MRDEGEGLFFVHLNLRDLNILQSFRMEFFDLDKATSTESCARGFCAMILRTLTFAIKHVSDDKCINVLDDIRSKYRMVSDTIMTFEQITEQVGSVLLKWAKPINNYDENFFLKTDLRVLVGGANAAQNPVTDADRERFYLATTNGIRTVILDALNLMLILYARYQVFQSRAPSAHQNKH